MIQTVAVYGASSTQIPDIYAEAARETGRLMGEHGLTLVNGAGNMGLMLYSAQACMEAGGRAVGVIPQFMIDEGWVLDGMTELIVTRTMDERKARIEQMTDGAIVLPGGIGTMDEYFELITLKQLGLYAGPIVLLNTEGYYDDILRFMRRAQSEQFMRALHANLWTVAETPAEALHQVLTTPLWSPDARRMAKI